MLQEFSKLIPMSRYVSGKINSTVQNSVDDEVLFHKLHTILYSSQFIHETEDCQRFDVYKF